MAGEVHDEAGTAPDVEAETDAEVGAEAGAEAGPLVTLALLTTLVVDGVLAAAIAIADFGYGQGLVHIVGIGLWGAVAVLNAVAAWNVTQHHVHGFASVLLAQVAALVLAGYVLLAGYQSPQRVVGVQVLALVVAVAAAGWVVYLVVKVPLSSSRTFSTGWKVVSASFALMSFFSLWLTTTYLPSTSRPLVDLTTALAKVDSNADTTVLKATITLHNRGLASAVVVGSVYRVHYGQPAGLPFTGPVSIDSFGSTVSEITTHQDDLLGRAFDFTAANTSDYTGKEYILKADEIMPMREFLLPGQTWSTEAVVTVPTNVEATVRLTAQIALITDRYLGDTRACQGATTNQLGADFGREAHTVHVVSLPDQSADGFTDPSAEVTTREVDYMCVQTALLPQSAVQNLVGNHPSLRTNYVLADGSVDEDRVPYLVTSFQNSGVPSGDAGIRQVQRIDAKNPTAVIESRSEYGVPGPADRSGG
jgi:hypothetical protein